MPLMLTGDTRTNKKGDVDYLTAIVKQCSKDAAIGGAKALANRPDRMALIASIKVPTLILVGLFDAVYPIEIAQMMQQTIPGSVLHVVPGAAHAAIFENADDSGTAIADWAAKMKTAN